MKLIWNMFGKDFSRVRLPWAVWVALLVADIASGSRILSGNGVSSSTQIELEFYRTPVYGLLLVLGYILAAWLVQLDGPVDSDADWMTRPISGWRLMAGKLLGIALLIWVPLLLIDSGWWILNGVEFQQIPFLTATTLGIWGVITLLAAFLASLSRDWPRFLLISLGVACVHFLLEFLGVHFVPVPRYSHQGELTRPLELSRYEILFATLLAAVVTQFLYRRTWRSTGIAVIGLLVVVASSEVPAALGYLPGSPPWELPRSAERLPDGVQVIVNSAQVTPKPTWDKSHAGLERVGCRLRVGLKIEGGPSGGIFESTLFDGELSGPAGLSIHEQWNEPFRDPRRDPERFSRALLGLQPAPLESVPGVNLRPSVASAIVAGPSTLRGRIYLERMELSVGATMSTAAGSTSRISDARATVVKTRVVSSQAPWESGRTWSVVAFVNVVRPMYNHPGEAGQPSGVENDLSAFVFWNRSRNEAVYATESTLASASVQGLLLQRKLITAPFPTNAHIDSQEKADTWISESKLAWVEFKPAGYSWSPLEITKFTQQNWKR